MLILHLLSFFALYSSGVALQPPDTPLFTPSILMHLPMERIDPAYRELIQINLALATAPGKNRLNSETLTLAQSRAYLSDPSIVPALNRLRQWLDKPRRLSLDTERFQENTVIALMENEALSEALPALIRVQVADGMMGDALNALRDKLRLARAMQLYGMEGWSHGIEEELGGYFEIARHLKRLSARDCDHLRKTIEEMARGRATLLDAQEFAYQTATQRLQRMAQKGATEIEQAMGLEEFAASVQENIPEEIIREVTQYREQMRRLLIAYRKLTPNDLNNLVNRAQAQLKRRYSAGLDKLQTPYATLPLAPPKPPDQPKEATLDDLAEHLAMTLAEEIDTDVLERHLSTLACLRMAACHAAVLRYHWEHEKYPASLAVLKLNELALDPYTGKPFVYKQEKGEYTIESAGPRSVDDKGNPTEEKNTLTLFPPEEVSSPAEPEEAPATTEAEPPK